MPPRIARAGPVSPGTKVYRYGEPDYEELRRKLVWQSIKPARFPSRIEEVRSAADVSAVLASARKEKRQVSIVSCGHNYVGTGVRDEAVVIYLNNLQDATVDSISRVATFQPGVRAYAFDALLQKANLAFPVPHNPTVGLAGFTLGGGMGWNAESWNSFACFNLRSIEVVLATGESVVADSSHHPDLFWAARGGGPFFPAVATRFHVIVFPRPAAIRESTLIYSIDSAPEVIAWLDKVHAAQDPRMELTLIFGMSDPAENKGRSEKQCIVSSVCFAHTEPGAREIYSELGRAAPSKGLVFKEELQPRTISDLLIEDKASLPNRHAVETFWTTQPTLAARILATQFLSAPTPTTLLYMNYRAIPKVPSGGVYSAGGSAFVFSDVSWTEEADDSVNRKWSDNFVASLASIDTAAYINETEIIRHPSRAKHCYSLANWERLKQVISTYDPTGLFVSPI